MNRSAPTPVSAPTAPLFAALSPGDHVRVRFRAITDAVWIAPDDDGTDVLVDAAGHAIDPALLVHLARGTSAILLVSSARDNGAALVPAWGTDALCVTAQHVASVDRL